MVYYKKSLHSTFYRDSVIVTVGAYIQTGIQ